MGWGEHAGPRLPLALMLLPKGLFLNSGFISRPFNSARQHRCWESGGSKPWTGAGFQFSHHPRAGLGPGGRRVQCARCDFTHPQPFAIAARFSHPLPGAPQPIRISFIKLACLAPGKGWPVIIVNIAQSQKASKAFLTLGPSGPAAGG